MSIEDEDDRREYYRIDDSIALQFTPWSGAEALAGDQPHDRAPLFNRLSEVHLADVASPHRLRPVSGRDRTLARRLLRDIGSAFAALTDARRQLLARPTLLRRAGEQCLPQ